MLTDNPRFAAEAGLAALRWLIAGYGYDIIGADVSAAYQHTTRAAAGAGCLPETTARIRQLLEDAPADGVFAAGIVRGLMDRTPGTARDMVT
jgi:hypothetical protein